MASSAPDSLEGLTLALVADVFTTEGLMPECRCVCLSPEAWEEEVASAQPDLLLVESAWRGNDGKWAGHVSGCSCVLKELIAHCRKLGIPTVFWNKEDPLHFEAFINSARLFDLVCTTDSASISRYRRELQHDRVYLLPFAYQPRLHHPIQRSRDFREEASVFAGAWYGNQAERSRDFVELGTALSLAGPIAIYDRATVDPAPGREYPESFRGFLHEGVPYLATGNIYRRYRIGLTLNTVKDSPTMFARRAVEMMGCNTSVYGNFSAAMHGLFGDLTVSSDDGERILAQAFDELRHPAEERYVQRRLKALRKSLLEYSWDARLSQLASIVWGKPFVRALENVNVLASVNSERQLGQLLDMLQQTVGVDTQLWVWAPPHVALPMNVERVGEAELQKSPSTLFDSATAMFAMWHPDDLYGPHYLQDMCLARKFGQGEIIGKAAYARARAGGDGGTVQSPENEYRLVSQVALRRALLPASCWQGTVRELFDSLDGGLVRGEALVSIDACSYVEGGRSVSSISNEAVYNGGLALEQIDEVIADLPASPKYPAEKSEFLSGATLAGMFAAEPSAGQVSTTPRRHRLELVSNLSPNQERVIYTHVFAGRELERNGRVNLCLDARPRSGVEMTLEELAADGYCVDRHVLPAGRNVSFAPSSSTRLYRLALRVRGAHVGYMDGLWLCPRPVEPLLLPGRRRLLLITNAYPSTDDLYRNAFVHRRVLAYRRRGVQVDVVRVAGPREATHTYEFQGVLVNVCSNECLQATLRYSGHRHIAVHFLDTSIWESLKPVADKARIVVWVHGSDMQPWNRRPAHYRDEAELALAKLQTETRLAFWRELLATPPQELHMVFVSHTFAEQSWEDLGLRWPDSRWSVIPNPIDCDLFEYAPKPAEQRLRILSVRPHHSRIYANDLIAETIRRLTRHEIFPELHFTLVGDGPLWDENFAGLDRLPNVDLIRRFIPQEEIAMLHKSHGVFLVPTRGDTQGVSRDEAMASGLVPVSCDVGAVHEFVPPGCGVLVKPESPAELAEAVLAIAQSPTIFSEMSALAAKAVGGRYTFDQRISNELGLLRVAPPEFSLDWSDSACRLDQNPADN